MNQLTVEEQRVKEIPNAAIVTCSMQQTERNVFII